MYFAYIKSPIGLICITEEEGFIISILFVNEINNIETQTNLLNEAKKQLKNYFIGKLKQFNLPIKQKGTIFQQSVWLSLQSINYAKTISYSKLANQLKNILAIRAIAAANGKNKILIVIPCHRVIGINGELIGYAGNTWRKKWLLNHENTILGVGQISLL